MVQEKGGREGFGGERGGQYGQVSGLFSSEHQWSATFFGVGVEEGRRKIDRHGGRRKFGGKKRKNPIAKKKT